MVRASRNILCATLVVAAGSIAVLSYRVPSEGVTEAVAEPPVSVATAPITAEGFARVPKRDWLVSRIKVEHWFCAKLEELVPEWTFVEEGHKIGRLFTPALDEDRVAAELRLRSAESALTKAQADAKSALATLLAAVADARAARQSAEEELAVVQSQPAEEDLSRLLLRISRNEEASQYARRRKELLEELARLGLCADVELREASRRCERSDLERRELDAALAEMEASGSGREAQRARLAARKAELDVRIAEARHEFESKRQPLLCKAIELGQVKAASRQLDLIRRRMDAAVLRAPSAGYVEYGRKWQETGPPPKLSRGDPVHFGQQIAAIVDVSQMQVRAHVGEREVLATRPGDRAQVEFEAVPDRTYRGCVEQVLPMVASDGEDLLEIDMEATERKGWVLVRLEDADNRIRPGMRAQVTITPADPGASAEGLRAELPPGNGAQVPEAHGHRAADGPASGLVLKGWLKASELRFLRSPFAGRVTGGAEAGTLVEPGDVVLKLDPGLQQDWLAEVESELERLRCKRAAASLELEMEQLVAPLCVDAAKAEVAMAQTTLEALKERPLPSEKTAAENGLTEAQWQMEASLKALAEFVQLAERGLASTAEVKQRELQVALAEAAVETAQARLDQVGLGASDLELAMAEADLSLAETARSKAEALAGAAVRAARAKLGAADAELGVYQEHAARQRAKAEKAELRSPISGILVWREKEGRETREDWWLAVIADTTQAQVSTVTDEPAVCHIRVGASAGVRLAGLPHRTFTGKVSGISDWRAPWWQRQRQSDGKERPGKLFEVVVDVEGDVPPCLGMSAVVEIERAGGTAPSLLSSVADGRTSRR